MSVAVPVVETWDGVNRRIFLKAGVSDFYPIEDIYHEYRNQRRLDESLRGFEPLLKAEGNVAKGAGAFTPRYVVLLDGTKIVPFNETLQINQLGDMLTDNPDVDPTLYYTDTLTVPKVIYIKPSEAETIQLNSEAIVFGTFSNMVWYDVNSPYDTVGTPIQPNGNAERPVNSIPLAVEIANDRGLRELFLGSDAHINSGTILTGFVLKGRSHVTINIVIADEAIVDNVRIVDCNLNGVLDGGTDVFECVIEDITYLNGHIHSSALAGRIILGGSKDAYIVNCSRLDFEIIPVIDMGGSGQDLVMPGYTGVIRIENLSGASNKVGIGLNSGQIILDSNTVTSGTVVASGLGSLVDESGNVILSGLWNGVTIQNNLINKENISVAVWDEQVADHLQSGSTGNVLGNSSFGDRIYLDADNGHAGTSFPIGTLAKPSSNLTDTVVIAEREGIDNIHFDSDYFFDNTVNISKYNLVGHSITQTILTFESGSTIAFCRLSNLTATGLTTGFIEIEDCKVLDLGSVGLVPSSQEIITKRALFEGIITLPSNFSGRLTVIDCYSGVPGTNTPVLDCGNSQVSLQFRNYTGGVALRNLNQGNLVSIDIVSGRAVLESTVTNAVIVVRGSGELVDEAGNQIITGSWNGGVTIVNQSLNRTSTVESMMNADISAYTEDGSTGKLLQDIHKTGLNSQALILA